MLTSSEHVVARRSGDLGFVTLDRPRAINALDLAMVRAFREVLDAWADDDAVAAVVVDGAGERGLCAGGDIKAFHASIHDDRGAAARTFFHDEYHLDHRLATYPKPTYALMHGLVLGGGLGVSGHDSRRLVTDSSRVGMPEVTIGLVPDVGGTWLLARAPGELGTHLALTACMVGPADAIACGLADVHVRAEAFDELRAARDVDGLEQVVRRRSTPPAPGELLEQRAWIDACYAEGSALEVVRALEGRPEPEARDAAATIRTKSPSAVAVAWAAVRRARALTSLAEALEQEYRVSCARLEHPDMAEGIRAQVIDRSRAPQWSPARLEDVDPALVEAHFTTAVGAGLGLPGC